MAQQTVLVVANLMVCGSKTETINVSFQCDGQTVEFADIWKSNKSEDIQLGCERVLVYASESWTVTQRTGDWIQVFINKCLRRILNIH